MYNKYKSIYISEDDLTVYTDYFVSEKGKGVNVVKLKMISTKLSCTSCSCESEIDAYNKAFEKLDNMYYQWLLKN